MADRIAKASSFRACPRRGPLFVAGLIAALTCLPALGDDSADSFLRSFVVGDYDIVGREPDMGASYGGMSHIGLDGEQLVLERQIGGRSVRAVGSVEVPSPPGEGRVLRFRWNDGRAMLMSCLVASDLDNYARLTCQWEAEDHRSDHPGLEAMFASIARNGGEAQQ